MNQVATQSPRITELTRRSIIDEIVLASVPWWGRLGEVAFLARLYDLKKMPSTDRRFPTAEGDIWKHRVNNNDWDTDWVFTDSRFNLLLCPDAEFLRFLCEMIHPVVQPREDIVDTLLTIFNRYLGADGFQVVETTRISGRRVFAARETTSFSPALTAVRQVARGLTVDDLNLQITRMATAVEDDPSLAIGTAKELIETSCKTILLDRGGNAGDSWDLTKLVQETLSQLRLAPKGISKEAEGTRSIRKTLGSLAQLAQGVAELRNLYGTGHGRDAKAPIPLPHHARLAVGAAATFAVFLFDTLSLDALVARRTNDAPR